MIMNGPKTMIFSLVALAGGVFLYRKVKSSSAGQMAHDAVLRATKKQTDDALVDAMSEQSFPASDAPAY